MSDFGTWYDFLAPSPDAAYGSIPPYACNRPGSGAWAQNGTNLRFALPDFLRSAAQGVVGLDESTQTGTLTPEALALQTSGSTGPVAALASRGALAADGAPRQGLYEQALANRAAEAGVDPRYYQEAAWAGAKDAKTKGGYRAKPMIEIVDEAIERTSRLTGLSPEEVVRRGLVRAEIPLYGHGVGVPVPGFDVRPQRPPETPGFRMAKDMVF